MDLFDLVAKITLDSSEYERGLDNASIKTSSFGDKLKNGLTTAAKIGGAAITAASTALVAFTKDAVSSFGDYEQLAGGIETLFGDSAKKVIADADEAFKTAGMSANQYMETSIQSAAALINSLDGDQEKAAELMNMSITDMADNVNKMGTSMEGVQNAYRGFSRGNFTMLDNLALGFAGTKEGMQQLLDKAEELSGVKYDIESYADIVNAIHVVQTEMGVTGTTAREASETIQGSLSAAKAAFENLKTGVVDENADMGKLTNQFVESVVTAAGNLIPRLQQILIGVGNTIQKLAPIIVDAFPGLISAVLPSLLQAAISMVSGFGNAVIMALPTVIDSGMQILFTLMDGIIEALPETVPAIVQVILTIVEKLTEPDTLMHLVDAAFQILGALARGIIEAAPKLIESVPVIISNLVTAIVKLAPQLLASGTQLVTELGAGILNAIPEVINVFSELFGKVRDWIHEKIEAVKEWGRDLIGGFVDGIVGGAARLWDTVKGVAQGIKDFLGFSEPEEGPLSNFHTFAPDMMELFAKGIRDGKKMLQDTVADAFDFGEITTESGRQSATASGSAGWSMSSGSVEPITIVVQSILDGEIIGESSYRYLRKKRMIEGVS